MSTCTVEDQQESMDTGSTHQEGGPATPMDDSMGQDVANTSTVSEGDADATPVEGDGDGPPHDPKWVTIIEHVVMMSYLFIDLPSH